jgi:hypothetical protein
VVGHAGNLSGRMDQLICCKFGGKRLRFKVYIAMPKLVNPIGVRN